MIFVWAYWIDPRLFQGHSHRIGELYLNSGVCPTVSKETHLFPLASVWHMHKNGEHFIQQNRTMIFKTLYTSGGDNLRIFLSKLSCFFLGSLRFDLETLDSPARCFTPFNGKGRLCPLHNSPRISFRCSLYLEWWWSNIYCFFFKLQCHQFMKLSLESWRLFLPSSSSKKILQNTIVPFREQKNSTAQQVKERQVGAGVVATYTLQGTITYPTWGRLEHHLQKCP